MQVRCSGGRNPRGEKENQPFQLSFNSSLKIDSQGSRVTSDGGLIGVRELDERLGLGELIAQRCLSNGRERRDSAVLGPSGRARTFPSEGQSGARKEELHPEGWKGGNWEYTGLESGAENGNPGQNPVARHQQRGRVISNPVNPSNKRLLDIKVKRIQGNEATVATTEYWHLRWWNLRKKSYVYPHRGTNRQLYWLRKEPDAWRVAQNLRPPPRCSVPSPWRSKRQESEAAQSPAIPGCDSRPR
jgi:hypothetical protein